MVYCLNWYDSGLCFGPLLSSLFINDVAYSLRYTEHMIFANDIRIYLICSPSERVTGLARATCNVEIIAAYARDNGLKLN